MRTVLIITAINTSTATSLKTPTNFRMAAVPSAFPRLLPAYSALMGTAVYS